MNHTASTPNTEDTKWHDIGQREEAPLLLDNAREIESEAAFRGAFHDGDILEPESFHKDLAQTDYDAIGLRAMRKVSWRVLPLIGFVYSISSTEKLSISLAADGIMRDLGLNSEQFGFIVSIYFVTYASLPVPAVMLVKKMGARVGLATLAFAFGVVSMSTAGVTNFTSLLILRLLLGATECGKIYIHIKTFHDFVMHNFVLLERQRH